MAYSTLSAPQLAWPAFDSIEIETPGAFANSDWVPLEAVDPDAALPLGADMVLTGATLRPTFLVFFPGGQIGGQLEIGAEVDEVVTPIATWPFINANSFNAAYSDNGLFLPTGLGIDLLPEGSRPMARIRSGQTGSANTWRVSATYMQKSLVGSLLTTTSPQVCIPDAAVPVLMTTGSGAWAESALSTIRAASGPALVLTGMLLWSNVSSLGSIEVDLYADGEFVHREHGNFGGGKQGLPYYVSFRRPLDAFPVDALIQAIGRCDYAPASPIYAYVTGHAKPL